MRNLMLKGLVWAKARQGREEGQTVIEYALVVALVSIVIIALLVGLGNGIIESAQDAVDAVLPLG